MKHSDLDVYTKNQLKQIIDNDNKEVEWLRYFYSEVCHYLGPAHSDAYACIIDAYVEAGKYPPVQYHYNYEGD